VRKSCGDLKGKKRHNKGSFHQAASLGKGGAGILTSRNILTARAHKVKDGHQFSLVGGRRRVRGWYLTKKRGARNGRRTLTNALKRVVLKCKPQGKELGSSLTPWGVQEGPIVKGSWGRQIRAVRGVWKKFTLVTEKGT